MKACPFCAEEIQDAATICKHCRMTIAGPNAGQSSAATVIVQERTWSPGVAAVLSLIIPGAGQMYKGQVLNGIVWLIFTVIGYALFIFPGLILHLCCIIGASMGGKKKADAPQIRGVSEEARKAETERVMAAFSGGNDPKP